MQINVAVTDANNIVCTIVPPQVQTITIDRGVAGNGIVSIVPVTISTFQYLRITYTNGTVSDVGPLTSTAYTATAPINITGNTISLLTVPIAVGGTGAVTAAAAIQNLLPSYTANGNKRLGLNAGATALEWVADGGGTVTSVAVSGGSTGLTTSGGPITGSGTITLAGTLAIANGGSGQTTAQAAMNAFAGAVTSGSYLRGDGTNVVMSGIQVGDVPTLNQNTTGTAANITATSNSTLTTLSVLSLPGSQVTGNISGNAANVTGIVAIANGGTGQTTANTALNALLPVQTGNATKYLQTDGTNASWDAISLSTADITGVLPTANGGTGLSAFTANQVFYASSTSAIAQSSNLQFNGTMLTAGSITNLALTPGRVTYTGSGNILTDSANLTFNGTNLSLAAGIANRVAYLNASKVLTTDDSFSIVNGQVGIGTVTPNNTLQVSGVLGAGITIGSGVNGTSGQLIIDTGTDGSFSPNIFGRGNGLNEWYIGSLRASVGGGALGMVDYVYGANPRVFYTNGTERMRILGSGNVGIATNTPTQLLDVNGNFAITGSARRITGNFGSGTVDTRILFQSSSSNTQTNIVAVENGTTPTGNGASQLIVADSAYATGANFVFGSLALLKNTAMTINSGANGTGSYLPMIFYTGGSERLRIDTSGNVTVGPIATLPNSTFAANAGVTARTAAASAITPYLQLYNGNSGTDLKTWRLGGQGDGSLSFEAVNDAYTVGSVKMTLTNAGNVGIGTSFPAAPLEISGTGTTSIITATSAASYSVLRLRNTGASGKSYEIAVAGNTVGGVGNSLYFYDGTATAVRLLIDTAGNVGIGTSSPGVKADINGVMRSASWSLSGIGVTGGTTAFAAGTVSTNTNWGMYFRAPTGSSTIAEYSFRNLADTERLRIDAAGNIQFGSGAAADTNGRFFDIYNTGASAGAFAIIRLITQQVASASTTTVDIVKYKNGTLAINNNDTNSATNIVFGVGASERLRITSTGNLSSAGGTYLTRYSQSNSFTPNSTNWIRLCTLSTTNQGQMVDFTFSIPGQHILFRVKFSKTTAGGFGGGGILDVELLGAYVYSNYTPFDWRLSDGGTNGPSHIDIRFPNNAGEAIGSIVNVISSYTNDVARHATFPMTNLGSGNTGGSYSNMGSAGAGGFTKQWFRMTGTKYVFYDNNMTITSGATPPTA